MKKKTQKMVILSVPLHINFAWQELSYVFNVSISFISMDDSGINLVPPA